jgi:hypothetical protein
MQWKHPQSLKAQTYARKIIFFDQWASEESTKLYTEVQWLYAIGDILNAYSD